MARRDEEELLAFAEAIRAQLRRTASCSAATGNGPRTSPRRR